MSRFVRLFALLLALWLARSATAQPTSLRMYGFIDTNLNVRLSDAEAGSEAKAVAFDQNHFNLISIFQVNPQFRVFSEVEWLHAPEVEGGEEGVGALALERAWVEYKVRDAFMIQAGKFLTPFGIYNLKNSATPTYLSTSLPTAVYATADVVSHEAEGGEDEGEGEGSLDEAMHFSKEFAMGVQVLGRGTLGSWEGEYALYVSSPFGDEPSEERIGEGFGGRLVVRPPLAGLHLGASYYRDTKGYPDNAHQTGYGLDAGLVVGGFQVEGELFLPHIALEAGDEEAAEQTQDGRGYYVQGAYTVFDRFTPYARYESFQPNVDEDETETAYVGGLNVAITSWAYLKNEIQYFGALDDGDDPFVRYVAAIAVAF